MFIWLLAFQPRRCGYRVADRIRPAECDGDGGHHDTDTTDLGRRRLDIDSLRPAGHRGPRPPTPSTASSDRAESRGDKRRQLILAVRCVASRTKRPGRRLDRRHSSGVDNPLRASRSVTSRGSRCRCTSLSGARQRCSRGHRLAGHITRPRAHNPGAHCLSDDFYCPKH